MSDRLSAIGDWSVGPGRLHAKLTSAIEAAVRRGAIAADAKLPSERSLARRLGVSRTTVGAAYSALASKGLVESRPVTRCAGRRSTPRPTGVGPPDRCSTISPTAS